jgi:hypothetical protein
VEGEDHDDLPTLRQPSHPHGQRGVQAAGLRVLGLVRTFAPEARQPGWNAAIDGVLAAMFTSGAVLTCKAYRPAIGQR